VIPRAVIVGEDPRDSQRERGDAGIRQSLIVAAIEERIAVLLVLPRFHSGGFARRNEHVADGSVVEPAGSQLPGLRAFVVVGAAHVLKVQIGDRVLQRIDRMGRIVAGAVQPLLFAEVSHENECPLGLHFGGAERFGEGEDRRHSAGVIIGAVVDAVAFAARGDTDMVVVGGQQHILVRQRRITAREFCDNVAEVDRFFDRGWRLQTDLRRCDAVGEFAGELGEFGIGRHDDGQILRRRSFAQPEGLVEDEAGRDEKRGGHRHQRVPLGRKVPHPLIGDEDNRFPLHGFLRGQCGFFRGQRDLDDFEAILLNGAGQHRHHLGPGGFPGLAIGQRESDFEAVHRLRDLHVRSLLKVGAVACAGFQTEAAELRGDVFARDVESARRRVAALEQIGGEERNVTLEGVRLDSFEDCGFIGRECGGVVTGSSEKKEKREQQHVALM